MGGGMLWNLELVGEGILFQEANKFMLCVWISGLSILK